MTRYVAFLRGINLGNRRIKMDELRRVFAQMDGLSNVATFIASGNVIFDSDAGEPRTLEPKIENHLAGALGYEVHTFLRTLETLETIAGRDRFTAADEDDHTVHVLFLKRAPDTGTMDRLRALEGDDDAFQVADRQVYWLRRGRMTDAAFSPTEIQRATGRETGTMRNMNTVRRIVAKFSVDDG